MSILKVKEQEEKVLVLVSMERCGCHWRTLEKKEAED